MATLPGVPLYLAYGFRVLEDVEVGSRTVSRDRVPTWDADRGPA